MSEHVFLILIISSFILGTIVGYNLNYQNEIKEDK